MKNVKSKFCGLKADLQRLRRDEAGTTLVELSLVLPIFLLIFFGLIDFGRMAFHYVTAEKAMHVAARIAAVRLPACPGVPEFHTRANGTPGADLPDFGTSCGAGPNICADIGTVSCSGTNGNPTASEIWDIVQGTLPNDATEANLLFSYSHDNNLGFLGGPYVPVVTVEIQNLDFQFISPLGQLVALTGALASPTLGNNIPFPAMSVSLPAEDLALGSNG